jgi:hypothetical protein
MSWPENVNVRADQADDLAAANGEARIVDGDNAAETLGDALHLENRSGHVARALH